MQDETTGDMTLGSAIDRIIAALGPLDEISRRTAIRAVCEQLGIILHGVPQQAPASTSVGEPPRAARHAPPTGPADIRSFAQTKSPATAVEQTALVAFYLSELAPETERKDSIDKEDLRKYFKQANFRLPRRPEVTLIHAKNAGYLDALGDGKYRLNAVGYNLIAHNLPREAPIPSRATGRRTSRKPRGVTGRRRAGK
jgi:hypothetical protein